MLMGYENRIHILDTLSSILQHLANTFSGESCINENRAVFRLQERTVARTAGTKNPEIIPH
uniref:Uncharacterized protein n=1 Tax=uncultured verrucomicrobium HF0500_27H16 TaxID=723600 RepID=E7C5L3_9BACT|nr:hypothetical protein [uncultured verrucomicrobium HF0500_27H16]